MLKINSIQNNETNKRVSFDLSAVAICANINWLKVGLDVSSGRTQWRGESLAFFILVTGFSWSGVQAPLGLQWFVNLLGRREFQVADFLWDGCALSNWLESGHKLGLESAGLLGVQVTGLLRNINKRRDDLIVALLSSLLSDTTSTADLNWQLLAVGVSNKCTRLCLNVLGCAGRLIECAALLRTLTIANLLKGLVAFLHSLIESLLLEGDLTRFFKVFLTNFLLSWRKLCDIGVVALFNIFVSTL